MKITNSRDINVLFYEYCFQNAIETYNENHKDNLIRTSEARELRRRLDMVMKAKNKMMQKEYFDKYGDVSNYTELTMKTCPSNIFKSCLNKTLKDRMGENFYTNENHKALLNKQYGYFIGMTKFSKGIKEMNDDLSYIPISPYMPDVAYRKAILSNGSRLSFVKSSEIENLSDLFNTELDVAGEVKNLSRQQNIKLYTEPFFYQNGGDIKVRTRELADKLLEKDDVSGLTYVMPYIKTDEYNAVRDWVNDEFDLNNITNTDLLKRQTEGLKSATILRGLSDLGKTYVIDKDLEKGQIRAKIDGTKINVRLTEKMGLENYIGSVYDNGMRLIYSSTRRGSDQKNIRPHVSGIDALNLVKLALGEPVKRFDSDKLVGESGITQRRVNGKVVQNNSSFLTNTRFTMDYDNLYNHLQGTEISDDYRKEQYFGNKMRVVYLMENLSPSTINIRSKEEAENYLKDNIKNARETYESIFDVDRLIDEVEKNSKFEDYDYKLDMDENIASIQQDYIDVLTGKKKTLFKPDADLSLLDSAVNDIDRKAILESLTYPDNLDSRELIKLHLKDSIDYEIGNFEKDYKGYRFNPVGVSKYSETGFSVFKNNADILEAMKILDINPDELKGNDVFLETIKENMVKFDKNSTVKMKDINDKFTKDIYSEIVQTLKMSGLEFNENDILMDKNGIVEYKGTLNTAQGLTGKNGITKRDVVGHVGQIFVPDEMGVVKTNFNNDKNYAFVPGYEASIKFQNRGENKTMEERTLFKGYKQKMIDEIRYNLKKSIITSKTYEDEIGSNTLLNGCYRHIYAERYDLDFVKEKLENGMDKLLLEAIIKTQAKTVRYNNDIRDGSSIMADFLAKNVEGYDYANDNTGDTYSLTGNRNISVLSKESDGIFDPILTTATSSNQGAKRFLTEDCEIDKDGFAIRGKLDGRCPLMAHEILRYSSYEPFDRQCMTGSNLLTAISVSKPVKSMDVTLAGYTQDDGNVITKRFAKNNPIRDEQGNLRDLTIQDKICDLHGNKGVVSYVVDLDKSVDDIKEECKLKNLNEKQTKILTNLQQMCLNNSDVDVYMAPFPAVSRFNAGTSKEKQENYSDGVGLDGNKLDGAVGEARFIITDKSADIKTHVYGEDKIGKGRRVSGQYVWCLSAKDGTKLIDANFSHNDAAVKNAREYFITCGMDIEEDGTLRLGYKPHEKEERFLFKLDEVEDMKFITLQNGKNKVDLKSMSSTFLSDLGRRGGMLELPFKLDYITGESLKETENGYELPILSSYLRSGQEFVDGTLSNHDYTNSYIDIYKNALVYKYNDYLVENGKVEKEDIEVEQKRLVENSQNSFNDIMNDVRQRKLEGKHNIFKDSLMSHRVAKSATAVWSENPTLKIDEIAISPKIAEVLDVKEDDYIMVNRDPMLRDSNLRYLKVKIDDNIIGCSINPNIAKSFEGDFDGDAVGVEVVEGKEAHKEAMDKFSIRANLLDLGHKIKMNDLDGNEVEVYPLNMNDGLDIQVAKFFNKDLDKKWTEMTLKANDLHNMSEKGMITGVKKDRMLQDFVDEMSDFYFDCNIESTAKSYIRYDGMQNHIQSVYDACIKTGAKGSPKKLSDYLTYLGVEGVEVDDNKINFDNMKVHDKSLATRRMNQDVMIATNVKNVGTGIAGSFSQKAMRLVGNDCPKAATELTYPLTQSILQSKHSAEDAIRRFSLLISASKGLWSGNLVNYNSKSNKWEVDYNKDHLTVDGWKRSFKELYTSDEGMGVKINDDYVDELANHLKDEDGLIKSVELDKENLASFDGAVMYKCAYGGGFDMLKESCRMNENLYEGKYTSHFAPNSIKNNQKLIQQREELRQIQKESSLEDELACQKGEKYVERLKEGVENKLLKTFTEKDVKGDYEIKNTKSDNEYGKWLENIEIKDEETKGDNDYEL